MRHPLPRPPPVRKLAPPDSVADLGEIVRGFDQFRQHLFRFDYTWELFREDCRRVVEILERAHIR